MKTIELTDTELTTIFIYLFRNSIIKDRLQK
jgi:hypothetical protein